MENPRKGYGTDPKYPGWTGAALSGHSFRIGMFFAIVINWTAIVLLFKNKVAGYPQIIWDAPTVFWSLTTIFLHLLTMKLINHRDAFSQNSMRVLACGFPLILTLYMLYLGS